MLLGRGLAGRRNGLPILRQNRGFLSRSLLAGRVSILLDWAEKDSIRLVSWEDSNASLTQLIKQYQQSMAYQIAEIYAYRGDSDLAFQWLNRAFQQQDSGMRNVKIDPLLKGLHQDPRYAGLLKRMRLLA